MAKTNPRLIQLSLRLNEPEVELLESLMGYRGLWERSEVLRYGLQLVSEESAAAAVASPELQQRRNVRRERKRGDS